jgi:tetratricopeptide (TPR) repeat protein
VSASVALLRRAVASHPNSAKAVFKLGTAMHRLGALEEAEALYTRAEAIDPAVVDLHNNLAVLYMNTARLDAADAAWRRGMARFPQSELLHATGNDIEQQQRAQSSRQSKKPTRRKHRDEGLPSTATRVDREDATVATPSRQSLKRMWDSALASHQRGDLDAAEPLYRALLGHEPHYHADLYNNLALLFANSGRGSEAHDVWREGLRRWPESALLRSNADLIARASGQFEG